MNPLDLKPKRDWRSWRGRLLASADRSLDSVLISELLEKYDVNRGFDVLRDVIRVLRPGGALRIVTPDFDWMMKQLAAPDRGRLREEGDLVSPLAGSWNTFFRAHGRKFIYD